MHSEMLCLCDISFINTPVYILSVAVFFLSLLFMEDLLAIFMLDTYATHCYTYDNDVSRPLLGMGRLKFELIHHCPYKHTGYR